jgi:MFS family permease
VKTIHQKRLMLAVIMLITFLGTSGIALPYPVLAPYFLDYPANDLTRFMDFHPKMLLGFALALYPLGMLIGSSFIGSLSDLYGRRLLLIITLIGTAISYLLSAYAISIESYVLFIFSRLFAGICEGNVAIARAMAADLHPHINKVRAMSLLFATVYAGWLFGPLAGGYLMVLGIEWVFAIAAIGTVITIPIVMLGVQHRAERPEEHRSLRRLMIEENSFALLKHRIIWPLFSFYFIYTLAINLFYEYYPVWLVERFGYNGQEIAWMTVIITTFMIISSVFIATRLIHMIGRFASLIGGVILVASFQLALIPSTEHLAFVFFALMGMTIAVNNAVTPTYMSDRFEHFGQGKVMGLQTSLFFLANVIMAIAGGLIAMFNVNAIMLGAGLLMLVSLSWLFMSGEATELKQHTN